MIVAVCRTEDKSVIEFKGLVVKIGDGYSWFRIILNDICYPCISVNLTLCHVIYIYVHYLFTFQQQTDVII